MIVYAFTYRAMIDLRIGATMLVGRNESWLSHNESINYALSYEYVSFSLLLSNGVQPGPQQ